MSWSGPLNAVGEAVHEIPASYRGAQGDLEMRVPGRIVATEPLLRHIKDDLALEQVAHVATLPGIVGASIAMPDIHHGYGFPIGGVAAFGDDGVVSPGGVGFDINCGVRLLATGLREEDLGDKPGLIDALFDAVPAGMGSRGKDMVSERALDSILAEGAVWAEEQGLLDASDRRVLEDEGRLDAEPAQVSDRARLRGRRSLGSLGSGNHFMEVQVVDEVLDEASASTFGVRAGQVVVMIHSGSRGLGHQVCQDHVQALQGVPKAHGIRLPDRQLACAPIGSSEADAYLGAMNAAANFAYVNRSILASHAMRVLEDTLGTSCRVVYDVCHNIAKWEDHAVDGKRQRVLVHRKGATRALPPGHAALPERLADVGQPVAVPGDMGRASWLLAGRPGSMELGFGSSCHGAGRRMARTQARKTFDGRKLVEELQARGITVRATTAEIAAEEAPEAYKDVGDVVGAVEAAGLAARVARMRPVGVVKG